MATTETKLKWITDAAVEGLLEACKEFVRKVECGAARSKRSYAQMKAAIAEYESDAKHTECPEKLDVSLEEENAQLGEWHVEQLILERKAAGKLVEALIMIQDCEYGGKGACSSCKYVARTALADYEELNK